MRKYTCSTPPYPNHDFSVFLISIMMNIEAVSLVYFQGLLLKKILLTLYSISGGRCPMNFKQTGVETN